MSRPRLRSRLVEDVRTGMAVAGAGLLVAALVEAIVTWKTFRGDLGAILTLRLFALALTLFGLTWLALGPLCGLAAAGPRLWAWITTGRGAALDRPTPGAPPSRWSPAAVARLLTGGLATVGYVAALTHVGARFIRTYKEPTLTALVTEIGRAHV